MKEYWIWLQRTLGAAARADDLLSFFGSPEKVYEAGRKEWILSGLVTYDMADKMISFSPSQSYDIIEQCEKKNWHIITPESKYYPEKLREIPSYPLVLYVWGDPTVLREQLMISFVGTRQASRYGLEVSKKLAYDIAKSGAVIVSGGALGIDTSSHLGAIEAGGKTIAFLGCGLGTNYLGENEYLRREISKCGAVVSEFLPNQPASKSTFPIRNRLISGISFGTVVVEAGARSGSLITAKYAAAQGRDVFAVPGDIINSNFSGANKLIQDGAKTVLSAADVLDNYTYLFPELSGFVEKSKSAPSKPVYNGNYNRGELNADNNGKKKIVKAVNKNEETGNFKSINTPGNADRKKPLENKVDESVEKVYHCLNGKMRLADEIADECSLKIFEVLSALTELEMLGLAQQHEGSRFCAVYSD